jgi:tetratricopeptide (TPR) repeat protein
VDERELEYKFNAAMEYEREGKYLHAIQIYSFLLTAPSYKRDAAVQLHKIYESLNNVEHASKVIKSYLDDVPGDFDVRKYYALFLIKHLLYEEAVDQLSYLSPGDIPEVKFLSGINRFFMKEYEAATVDLSDFLTENNSSEYLYDAYFYLAKAHLELNNLEKALEAAREADKIFSRSEELQLLLTKIYLLKGLNFHAFDSISKGLRINNESHQMNELAGRILFDIGEFDKAENHLNKIVSQSDQQDEILTLLGHIYLKKTEFKKAEAMFSRALEINPTNCLALEKIKVCSENLDRQNISQ